MGNTSPIELINPSWAMVQNLDKMKCKFEISYDELNPLSQVIIDGVAYNELQALQKITVHYSNVTCWT